MTPKLDAYQELKTQAPIAEQVAALAATTDKNKCTPKINSIDAQGIVWIRTLLNPRFALFDPKAVHNKDCERLFFVFIGVEF